MERLAWECFPLTDTWFGLCCISMWSDKTENKWNFNLKHDGSSESFVILCSVVIISTSLKMSHCAYRTFTGGGWEICECLLYERLDAWCCFSCKVGWSELRREIFPLENMSHWYLQILFCSLLTQGLAGIQPVNVPGIENVSKYQLHSFPRNNAQMFFTLFPFPGWCHRAHWRPLFVSLGHSTDPGKTWIRYILPCFLKLSRQTPVEICRKFIATSHQPFDRSCNACLRTPCSSPFSVTVYPWLSRLGWSTLATIIIDKVADFSSLHLLIFLFAFWLAYSWEWIQGHGSGDVESTLLLFFSSFFLLHCYKIWVQVKFSNGLVCIKKICENTGKIWGNFPSRNIILSFRLFSFHSMVTE